VTASARGGIGGADSGLCGDGPHGCTEQVRVVSTPSMRDRRAWGASAQDERLRVPVHAYDLQALPAILQQENFLRGGVVLVRDAQLKLHAPAQAIADTGAAEISLALLVQGGCFCENLSKKRSARALKSAEAGTRVGWCTVTARGCNR
jgi:hypothetical protein